MSGVDKRTAYLQGRLSHRFFPEASYARFLWARNRIWVDIANLFTILIQTLLICAIGGYTWAEGTRHWKSGCLYAWMGWRDYATTWIMWSEFFHSPFPSKCWRNRSDSWNVHLFRIHGRQAPPTADFFAKTCALHLLLWGVSFSSLFPTVTSRTDYQAFIFLGIGK